MTNLKQTLWQKQSDALRNPEEVLAGSYELDGLQKQSLSYSAEDGFQECLHKLQVTLFVTREYEHLALSLTPSPTSIEQRFVHLPHPSGLAVDRNTRAVYIAATRNPNQIWEFKPATVSNTNNVSYLMPTRTKYYPGKTYFHDLAFVGDSLFCTSVGQNVVIPISLQSSELESPVWWPKCIEKQDGSPDVSANHLQLNSIAAGKNIEQSFFSASSDHIRPQKPGDQDYPVDGTGVIFSGKTGEVFATGLTRPHSARQHKGKLWVDNSGYGTVGYIEHGKYMPQFQLPGWTRGLCFIDDFMFVGVSRVLPRFEMYAPGLSKEKRTTCGIYIYNLKSGECCGKLIWPNGNQIFAIDYISSKVSQGFLHTTLQTPNKKVHQYYSAYSLQ